MANCVNFDFHPPLLCPYLKLFGSVSAAFIFILILHPFCSAVFWIFSLVLAFTFFLWLLYHAQSFLSSLLTHNTFSFCSFFNRHENHIVIFYPCHNLITRLINDRPLLQFLFLLTFSLNHQTASLHHKIPADLTVSLTTIIHQNRAENPKSLCFLVLLCF